MCEWSGIFRFEGEDKGERVWIVLHRSLPNGAFPLTRHGSSVHRQKRRNCCWTD
jgi:hypothetical protein